LSCRLPASRTPVLEEMCADWWSNSFGVPDKLNVRLTWFSTQLVSAERLKVFMVWVIFLILAFVIVFCLLIF